MSHQNLIQGKIIRDKNTQERRTQEKNTPGLNQEKVRKAKIRGKAQNQRLSICMSKAKIQSKITKRESNRGLDLPAEEVIR